VTLRLTHAAETFPIRGLFRISRGARTESLPVVATLQEGDRIARGECMPYARYDETIDSVRDQIESVAKAVADGADRLALQDLLPPGENAALGDMAGALETVQREAVTEEKAFSDHLSHMIVHGTLHLLGYDHEMDDEAEEMEALEREVLATIGIADPYMT